MGKKEGTTIFREIIIILIVIIGVWFGIASFLAQTVYPDLTEMEILANADKIFLYRFDEIVEY